MIRFAQRLSRPSKLLFVGVAVALLTIGVGWFGTGHVERELVTLRQTCEKEASSDPDGFRLVCDPQALAKLAVDDEPPGIQGKLFRAERRLAAWEAIPFNLAALVVAALCALPWLWYFLLARIRELSAAIRNT